MKVRELASRTPTRSARTSSRTTAGCSSTRSGGTCWPRRSGSPLRVAQTNHSASKRGVVRGVHFALLPPGQAKYVYVPRGAALDIVVDIRLGSPTYGQHDVVRLDDRDFRAVYLSEGSGTAWSPSRTTRCCPTSAPPGTTPDREKGISPVDPGARAADPGRRDAAAVPEGHGRADPGRGGRAGPAPDLGRGRAFYASLR